MHPLNPASSSGSPDCDARRRIPGWLPLFAVLLSAWLSGCTTRPLPTPTSDDAAPYSGATIQAGDQIRITFPGAPNLNVTQVVRVDGQVSLGTAGNIGVLGKTPTEVEAELLERVGSELVVKEVQVAIDTAGFPVFITGAVLRPGKIMVNRSVTVLEAIMEAGGYDPNRANLKKVQVVRQQDGKQRTFQLNLQDTLVYAETEPFHLRPSDVVVVPERFVFF